MKQLKLILVFVIMACSVKLVAQTKPALQKYKVPKLYTQLGTYRDSVTLSVNETEDIAGKALRIFDDNKGVYTISSYQFLYRKKGVTEDEETGKVSPITSMVSSLFKVTPLPDAWLNQVRAQVKSGEELLFFDVIAKDDQGRVMYAPDFKVKVL